MAEKNKKQRITIAAVGRTHYLLETIKLLVKNGYSISLIITDTAAPEYKATVNDFRKLAKKLKSRFVVSPVLHAPSVVRLIEKIKPDVAVSINWKTLIPQRVINLFQKGIINAHAGDLPRYRGNAAPNWAILQGEKKIGVTLHLMDERLDSGPIILKKFMPLTDATYIGDFYQFLEKHLPAMFLTTIKKLARGEVKFKKQSTNPHHALRGYPRLPQDSELDWRQRSEYLAKVVRASSEPFDGAYTFLNGVKLIVWRAHSEKPPFKFLGTPGQVAERRAKTGEVVVITGDGFLVLEKLEWRGKKSIQPTEIITSSRIRLGLK